MQRSPRTAMGGIRSWMQRMGLTQKRLRGGILRYHGWNRSSSLPVLAGTLMTRISRAWRTAWLVLQRLRNGLRERLHPTQPEFLRGQGQAFSLSWGHRQLRPVGRCTTPSWEHQQLRPIGRLMPQWNFSDNTLPRQCWKSPITVRRVKRVRTPSPWRLTPQTISNQRLIFPTHLLSQSTFRVRPDPWIIGVCSLVPNTPRISVTRTSRDLNSRRYIIMKNISMHSQPGEVEENMPTSGLSGQIHTCFGLNCCCMYCKVWWMGLIKGKDLVQDYHYMRPVGHAAASPRVQLTG